MKTSEEYKKKANVLIPGSTSTRGRRALATDLPLHALYGDGAYIIDIDDRRLLDTRGALGTNVLGYGFLEKSSSRLKEAFRDSPSFSLTCKEEVELAEILLDNYLFGDMIRFFKTGAEACSAAVRLVRAATEKNVIISCGYHGWHDQWATGIEAEGRKAIPNLGVVPCVNKYIYEIEYGDTERLMELANSIDDLAGIITIPLDWNCDPNKEFIKTCRKIADCKKACLIYDEIFSALRLDKRGGLGYYGVEPDVVCIGKAVASGYPLTAVLGKRSIMEYSTKVLMSSTYATDKISLVASIETLRIIKEEDVLSIITQMGEEFVIECSKLLNGSKMFMAGHKSVPRLKPIIYEKKKKVDFARFMFKKNILSYGIFFFSYSHDYEDMRKLLNSINEYAVNFGE